MMGDPKLIVIAGYYGFGNTGDEAILMAMIQDLRALQPDVDLLVLSGNPQGTTIMHQVKAVAWTDMQGIADAVTACDLVILGGGGILHDYWGVDPTTILTPLHSGISFYVSIATLATLHDKPIMLYGVGIGPLLGESGEFYTRAIVEQAGLISVRDDESKKLLVSLGIAAEKIYRTADPAFRLQPASLQAEIAGLHPQDKPVIGIALRNWDVGVYPESWEREVAQALDSFLDGHAGTAIFVPFQESSDPYLDDRTVSRRIQQSMRHADRTLLMQGIDSPAQKAGLLARCDLVLGMRLHAVILAINSGVPIAGLVYDPKNRNIMAQAGIESFCLDLQEVTSVALSSLLEQSFIEHDLLSRKIRAEGNALSKQAQENAALAIGILNGSSSEQQIFRPTKTHAIDQVILSLTRSLDAHAEKANRLTETIVERQYQVENQARIVANLETQAVEREENVRQRDNMILEMRRDLEVMEGLKAQAAEHEQVIQFLNSEMETIKGSRGWKLLWTLWKIRLWLIPHGTVREKVLIKSWGNPFGFLRKISERALGKFSPGISRYAFPFDIFKRSRNRSFPANLSSLHFPGESGLVSIVLPVYNGAGFLAEALDSILNQSYTNFELIAIDDGSQDATGMILDQYAEHDSRIRVVHQENCRLPRALNRGFQLARGQYLTWTSHDNRLRPEYLQSMVGCLERHPDWDMTYADMDMIGEHGAPLRGSDWFGGYQSPRGSEHVFLPEDTAELNTFPNNFIGGAFLYRDRVPWLIGDYNPREYTREDYDYWMRVNSLLTLRHVDFKERYYEYRFHSASLTHRDNELGITRDRKNLMVLDDFRRDFHLSPMLWIIDEDLLPGHSNKDIASLKAFLSRAGHILIKPDQINSSLLPRLWAPLVYLYVTEEPLKASPPPGTLPPNTTRVLLSLSTNNLPETLDAKWDLCLARGPETSARPLDGDRRGWLVSQDMITLLTAIDIRSRSRQIESIEREISEIAAPEFKISVIICTHSRGAGLEDALRSVARQSMPKVDYEVILVDNDPGGSELTPLLNRIQVEEFANYPGHLKLVLAPMLGLSHARNAGISEAKGEILFFLDDDARAKADILEQYWRAFCAHPDAGVMGGHVLLSRPDRLSIPWKEGWERYWSQFVSGYPGYTVVKHWWEFPWGANWCARRQALMRVGGFRGRFGRRGADFGGGEELVAASLIQELGYSVSVLPQAEVTHYVEPDRFTLDHLKRTIRAGLFAEYLAQVDLYIPMETSLGSSFRQLIRNLSGLLSVFNPKNPGRTAILYETYYYLTARWQLMCRQIGDGLRRMRKPITSQAPAARRGTNPRVRA